MNSRIQFFDRYGKPIDEIEADVYREWGLNDVGECNFNIPRTHPKLRESLIRYGNLILVTGGTKIKDWVGVIDLPRYWSFTGVRVTAYSAEILLGYRHPDKVNEKKHRLVLPEKIKGAPGVLFDKIIDYANEDEDTLIRPGKIWRGGIRREQPLKDNNYYLLVKRIADRAGNNFNVTGSIEDDRLVLKGNWYERLGVDRANSATLEEGMNLETTPDYDMLTEDGELMNRTVATGQGSTSQSKIAVVSENAESRALYGLRQPKSIQFSGIEEVETLQENAQTRVDVDGYPRKRVVASVTDPDLIAILSEGDIVRVELHSMGFLDDQTIGLKAYMRVLGMGYQDSNGVLDLVLSDIRRKA